MPTITHKPSAQPRTHTHLSLHSLTALAIPKCLNARKQDRNERKKGANSLLDDPLDAIQPFPQHIHPRPIRHPHEMMARRIEQVPTLGRVQVEEDARDDDDLLLEAGLEEGEAVCDGFGEAGDYTNGYVGLAGRQASGQCEKRSTGEVGGRVDVRSNQR